MCVALCMTLSRRFARVYRTHTSMGTPTPDTRPRCSVRVPRGTLGRLRSAPSPHVPRARGCNAMAPQYVETDIHSSRSTERLSQAPSPRPSGHVRGSKVASQRQSTRAALAPAGRRYLCLPVVRPMSRAPRPPAVDAPRRRPPPPQSEQHARGPRRRRWRQQRLGVPSHCCRVHGDRHRHRRVLGCWRAQGGTSHRG